MLFHTFRSQEERRKFGGSYFIEIQYCQLAPCLGIEELIAVDAIEPWKMDSLYICGDDDNRFLSDYGGIFTDGIYHNQKSGFVDIYGINYYSQEQTKRIQERIEKGKPLEYQTLLEWLERAAQSNGFYILGF